MRYIPSAVVAVVVVALVVVVFVVDVIVGVVVVVLQSARWEKSQTDDLKGKSLILKHSKKNLNLQSNSSLPKGQVISLVMHSGHSIRHAPEGPHSQNRPQSEVYLRDILTQKLTVFVHMKVSGAFISRAIRDSASIVEDSVGGVGARVVGALRQPGGWRTDTGIRANKEPNKEEEVACSHDF